VSCVSCERRSCACAVTRLKLPGMRSGRRGGCGSAADELDGLRRHAYGSGDHTYTPSEAMNDE
jgi:hypothetical protein